MATSPLLSRICGAAAMTGDAAVDVWAAAAAAAWCGLRTPPAYWSYLNAARRRELRLAVGEVSRRRRRLLLRRLLLLLLLLLPVAVVSPRAGCRIGIGLPLIHGCGGGGGRRERGGGSVFAGAAVGRSVGRLARVCSWRGGAKAVAGRRGERERDRGRLRRWVWRQRA